MLGCWRGIGEDGQGLAERYVTQGEGIVGRSAFLKDGRVVQRESTTIEVRDGKVMLVPTVDGRPSDPFMLVQGAETNRVVFENAAHDFPQRIVYRATSGGLVARIEGDEQGRFHFVEWSMRGVDCREVP